MVFQGIVKSEVMFQVKILSHWPELMTEVSE